MHQAPRLEQQTVDSKCVITELPRLKETPKNNPGTGPSTSQAAPTKKTFFTVEMGRAHQPLSTEPPVRVLGKPRVVELLAQRQGAKDELAHNPRLIRPGSNPLGRPPFGGRGEGAWPLDTAWLEAKLTTFTLACEAFHAGFCASLRMLCPAPVNQQTPPQCCSGPC